VDVIWHYDQSVKTKFFPVPIDADFEHHVAGGFRENPSLGGGEGNEEGFVVWLVVWKFAAIFVLSFHLQKPARARTPVPPLF